MICCFRALCCVCVFPAPDAELGNTTCSRQRLALRIPKPYLTGALMEYRHTQKSPLYLLLIAIAMLLAINGWVFRDPWVAAAGQWLGALLFGGLAMCFRQLTTHDAGDRLAVRFGPIGLFGTQVRYDTITRVELGHTKLIDGLGIHYIPGRGWTYNLWGSQCVVIHRGERLLRIGTDDVNGLLSFLSSKIAARAEPHTEAN